MGLCEQGVFKVGGKGMIKKMLIMLGVVVCSLGIAKLAEASFITSSSDPALNGATVIDFENQTKNTYTTLSIGNVSFEPATGYYLRIDSYYSGRYNTAGKYLDNGRSYNNPGFGKIKFSFLQPVSAFGFNWGASNYYWLLKAYNSSGVLLESYDLPITKESNNGEFYGIAVDSDFIAYASLERTSYYDWIFLDNFTFKEKTTETVIPEPTTFFLLGWGLIGVSAFKSRKKK